MSRLTARVLVAVALAATLGTACAAGAPMGRPAAFPGAPVAAADAHPLPNAGSIVQSALEQLGRPYRFGGGTPDTGFDCSGLVAYVMGRHAIPVPRTTAGQYAAGDAVLRDRLRPGDLVFFQTTGPGPTHVGIVTNPAESEFVHAPAGGSTVRLDRYDAPYWRTRWVGARRLTR